MLYTSFLTLSPPHIAVVTNATSCKGLRLTLLSRTSSNEAVRGNPVSGKNEPNHDIRGCNMLAYTTRFNRGMERILEPLPLVLSK